MLQGGRLGAWALTASLQASMRNKRGGFRTPTCCFCALWKAMWAAALSSALCALAAHQGLQGARGLLTGRAPRLGVLIVAAHVLHITLAALPAQEIVLLTVLLLQHRLALLQQLLQVLSTVLLCAGLRLLMLVLQLLLALQRARRGRLLRHGPVRGLRLLLRGAEGCL